MTSFYGTATLCEVKYNSGGDERHTPYRVSCWTGVRDNGSLSPDFPTFNLPSTSTCSVSYYEYLRSLYEGRPPGSLRGPGSGSSSVGAQSAIHNYASKFGYVDRRPKTAVMFRSEPTYLYPQQQKSLPSLVHHEAEEDEESDGELTLLEDRIVWVDALNKWVPEQQLQPKPYISFVGNAPTVARLYTSLKETATDEQQIVVAQKECNRYNKHMESYKSTGLKEHPLHPDQSYANRLMNLKKREELRKRAEELLELRRQRLAHTSPTASALAEKKQKVRFKVPVRKKIVKEEKPVPTETTELEESELDGAKFDGMVEAEDTTASKSSSEVKVSSPTSKQEVAEEVPESPIPEEDFDSLKSDMDKKDEIETPVTLPPVVTETEVLPKKKVREVEVFMDFRELIHNPCEEDQQDSPKVDIQGPDIVDLHQQDVNPPQQNAKLNANLPPTLSNHVTDVKKKKTVKERIKAQVPKPVPATVVRSSKSLIKVSSKTSKKSVTDMKKSELFLPVQKKRKTIISKTWDFDHVTRRETGDNSENMAMLRSSEEIKIPNSSEDIEMSDSVGEIGIAKSSTKEKIPKPSHVKKIHKSKPQFKNIKVGNWTKQTVNRKSLVSRKPMRFPGFKTSAMLTSSPTLPVSSDYLEAPFSNLDVIVELDQPLDCGVTVCITDFSDLDIVPHDDLQVKPRGEEKIKNIPTIGDTKRGPLELTAASTSPRRPGTPAEKKELIPGQERRHSILRKERYDLRKLLKERSEGTPSPECKSPSPTSEEEEEEEITKPTPDALPDLNLVLSKPHVCIDEPPLPDATLEKKHHRSGRRGTLVTPLPLPKQKLKRRQFSRDTTYEDELRKFELAEKRRQKQMEMLEKLKHKKQQHELGFDDDDDSPNFEDYGFLSKYCIFNKGHLQMYKHTFDIVDDENKGWLQPIEVMMALRGVNNKLSDAEEEYLYRLLELTGYSITKGADFKLFAVLAALSQKISSLDDWMRNQIGKMDFQMLEMKTFMCKTLWECNVDHDINKIPLDQLCVDLRAGGISLEHEDEVRRTLSHLNSLDLLDFLTYIPLFIMIHQSVVENPLDSSRDK